MGTDTGTYVESRMRKQIVVSRIALLAPIFILSFLACSSGDDSSTSGGGKPGGDTGGDAGTSSYGADGSPNNNDDGGSIVNKGDGGDVTTTDGGVAGFTTIFTIVLENHDYAEVVGDTTDAPFSIRSSPITAWRPTTWIRERTRRCLTISIS